MELTTFLAAFGANPTGDRLARIQRSPQFRDGKFRNPVETNKMVPGAFWTMLRRQFTGGEQRVPPAAPPIDTLTTASFAQPPASGLRVTWLGHATALIEIDGHRVLVDPVWSGRASPSQRFGPKRFHPPPIPLHALPRLDAIVLTHDHYDHLDMAAVQMLMGSVTQERVPFIAPLGVGAHLERWGIVASRITELDWWETTTVGRLTLAAGSARHFSGRGPTGGDRTLWASWSIIGPAHRVFHSGDTGPFDAIAENGRRYGPFDLTMIKIGAYGETWPDIHLTPEQAVRAHTLVQGRLLLPIHWGTFNLAHHAWSEPAERVLAAATVSGVPIVIPRPGQPVEPATPPRVVEWWREAGREARRE
jgi:L-ascorbate metabolism protein UlaG (beta-lactamase superfamily)